MSQLKPILFSDPMVRALLAGRKTQTRRVIKPQPKDVEELHVGGGNYWPCDVSGECAVTLRRPYAPGDLLFVREAAYVAAHDFGRAGDCRDDQGRPRVVDWAATMDVDAERCATDFGVKKSSSIHMPRWACRIVLRVTDVREQRVQEISEADAIAEGVEHLFTEEQVARRPELKSSAASWKNYLWHGHFGSFGMGSIKSDRWQYQYSGYDTARDSFSSLWELVNGYGAWKLNPWVRAVSFEVAAKTNDEAQALIRRCGRVGNPTPAKRKAGGAA